MFAAVALKAAALTAETAVVSSVTRDVSAAVGEDAQKASFTAAGVDDGHRRTRRRLSGASFAISAAATALLVFGLYEISANPPHWYGGGDKYSYGFQFVGAVAFLVPVALVAACGALAGAALWRGPRGRLWRLGEHAVLTGWLPALVTVAGVAVADQLLGEPATDTTFAGAGLGMVALTVMWLGARGALRGPVLPRVTQAVTVAVVVAAFVGASTITRLQDEHNLVIYLKPGAALADPAPLSAGFHTVKVQEVASVRGMLVTCTNSSDCVAVGSGTYPGAPSPFMTFGMVGASSDGGSSWSVRALPLSVLVPLSPSCADRWCNVPLEMASGSGPHPELRVTFGGRGAPARFSYLASAPQPPGSTRTMECDGNECIVFAEVSVRGATTDGSTPPGSPDQRPGPHEVAAAWYSSDGGGRWARTVLPEPHSLTTAGSVGPPGLTIFGPWCSNRSHCTGALSVEKGDCSFDLLPPRCLLETQMLFTEDGGRTWTGQVLPATLGNIQGLSCEAGKYCTAVGLNGRLVLSDDGGRTWSTRGPAPEHVYCWSATACIAADFMSDDFRTTDDGGRHWEQQSLGTVGVQSFYPVYCSPKGQCIADGVDRLGQEYVLTGSAHASAWVSHPFPTPQMLSLPRQL